MSACPPALFLPLFLLTATVALAACASPGAGGPGGVLAGETTTLTGDGGVVSEDPWMADDTGLAEEQGGGDPGGGGDSPGEDDGDGGDGGGGSAGAGEDGEPEVTGGWVCDKSFRNGSEICDDAVFSVPSDGTPVALICVTDLGGVGYLSTNTGPTMSDGMARCQGWEENGEQAWDHLEYIDSLVCDAEGLVLEVDVSAWAGQKIWAGVHDHPDGSGHFTEVCVATWEEGA